MTSSSLRRTAFTIALVLLAGALAPSSILGAAGPSTPLRAGQTRASAPATLRIYLARHGQTDWNVEGRMQGGTDTPLNATGRQQAAALKDHLKNARFDAVYSSTLSRSRETAEIVRGQVPLTSLAGLGERRFGKFEGLLSDAPDTGPEFQRRRWDPQDALDGGESWVAFTDRVRSALQAIRTKHPSGAILIVGHGGTNQALLQILLGLSLDDTRSITQANDELYLIELDGTGAPRLWKLVTAANLRDL
jgi:2,3-bisphosphoglycerate-dependent phosphoglycerate mutase